MNREEKKGCESILRKIDHDDLMSLKDTVTKRQIAAENTNEAVQAILTYSESSLELLRRKKIRREVLFKYLADNGVTISVNAEKHQLIKKILEFWGIKIFNGSSHSRSHSPDSDVNQNSTEGPSNLNDKSSGTQSSQNDIQRHSMATQSCDTPAHSQVQLRHESVPVSDERNQHVSDTSVESTASTVCVKSEHRSLAETFISWFYKMLNSHNPCMNQTPEDFGPHHFWNDVRLHLLTLTTEQQSDTYEGSVLVSQRFLAFVKEEQLLFNPNVSIEGIKVKSDPHGLLIIMVCGTIHRSNDCLGMFQQMFGLIRDPRFDNNWKIKVTKLRIQSTQVTLIPKLLDSDTVDLLAVIPASNALAT